MAKVYQAWTRNDLCVEAIKRQPLKPRGGEGGAGSNQSIKFILVDQNGSDQERKKERENMR